MTITTFPAPSRAADSAGIVARNLKRLMVERDVKQGQLAAVLGITQSNVSKRLKGRTPFTTDDLDALAQAFQVHPVELLTDRGQSEAVRTPEEVRTAGGLPRLDSNQQPAGRSSLQVIAGFRTTIGPRRDREFAGPAGGYPVRRPVHDRILRSGEVTAATQASIRPIFGGACVESDRKVA